MALDLTTPFVWGSGGAQLTPAEIEAQRKVAQAMLAKGGDYSPVQSWSQGAARVAQALFGGLMAHDANEAAKTNAANDAAVLASIPGFGTTAASPSISTAPATPSVSTPMGRTSIPASADKIYSNDEPSPLDPPSGTDRDAAIRTVLAEAGNQGPTGMNAVASVIRNRAVNGGFGGNTPSGVVTAPNQFEPWNTAAGRSRMAAIDPNSPAYANAGQAIDSAYMGNDPTNGAVNFIAPKAQVALGRQMPAWAQGPGQDIGDHRFFGGAPQTAQSDPAALPANSQPAQGFAVPGQPAAPQAAAALPGVNPRLVAAMASPYTSEGTKKILGLVLSSQMSAAQKAADPMRALQMEKLRSDIAKPSTPTSVQEYEYYKANLPDGQSPMDYGTWSTAKARAGATMINNNVGTGETAFAKEAGKVQASRFNDLVEGGQQAKQMLSDVNTLTDLGKNIGTGKGAQFKAVVGPYAEALGVPVKGLSDIQAYEAIVNRVAPTLRVKGSGAQSDFELKNFLKSLPSLGNTPEGNNIAASVLQGFQQNKVLAAEIGSKALNGEITRAEADKQLRDLPDPMIPYREYRKNNPVAQSKQAAPDPAAVEAEMKRRGLL